MLDGKTIAVVVPAYNEEKLISTVINTMPDFVDRIIVVNDCSRDRTEEIVRECIKSLEQRLCVVSIGGEAMCSGDSETSMTAPIALRIPAIPDVVEETFFNRADVVAAEMRREEETYYQPHEIVNDNDTDRIVLINNLVNSKAGSTLRVGYKWCRDHGIDCTAVMAGDAQMDPNELEMICRPVIDDGVDYVKGNRLSHKAAKRMVPPKRYFGNSVLSAMTKMASGYWRVSDTQTGYTAISLHALNSIDLWSLYPTYGVPNDILIKLNIANCTLREVPIKPVYAVGEQSKMKIWKVIPTVSWLLISGYFKRICKKYLLNDFHPIFLFYFVSWLTTLVGLYFLISIIVGLCADIMISTGTYMGFIALLITSLVTLGFGMWLDVDDNERLNQ